MNDSSGIPQPGLRFLKGDGDMAARIRSHDWASSSVGIPASWPASLRTCLGLILKTSQPAFIFWGPELLCFYNDAYSASLGPEKHPRILGMPGKQAFSEIWEIVGSDIENVLAGGLATGHENQLLPVERNGRFEDVHWTYSYAGVDEEDAPNGVGGVLVLCTETTKHLLGRQKSASELARMAQLFEQAPLFLAVLSGPNHRFDYVNPSYRTLFRGRELLGRSVAEAVPEASRQGYGELLDRVYATGKPHTAIAASLELATGREGETDTVTLDFVFQPMLGEDGRVDGILVVGVDVSERTAAKRALEVSEEQLRLALDAGEVGLWDVDPIAGTLFWPSRVRRMFGIFTDRPVTMCDDFYGGIHEDDVPKTASAFAAALDPEMRSLYDVEYRTIGHEDRITRWVAAKGRGVFDGTGKCIRVIGTAVDITDRKRDESRLKDLNETLEKRLSEFLTEKKLFADIFEETDTFIQVLDRQFGVLAINRACADEIHHVFGIRPRVGDNLLTMLNHLPEQQEEVRLAWTRGLNGERFTQEAHFGDPSRRRRRYEIHFGPLFSQTGERIGAYQFAYDVTARYEAEHRLAKAEAALQHAQKMEALGMLTGGIAHDFNNLLQAVSAKFELIRRRPGDPEKVSSLATKGVDVARRGARLTAQLLTFSKSHTHDVRPVRLSVMLTGMRDLLGTTLGANIALVIECPDLWVRSDPIQLEMALVNLAVNSRDVMPGGGVFTVSARAAGESVELWVADTGPGMSQDVLARAFEPFFTTKGIGKGSGLGLAQVYGMAKRAGGSVRLDSDGVHGLTVVIALPKAEPQFAEPSEALPVVELHVARPITVLVVDDDDQVRDVLVELLGSFGYEVLAAANGENALLNLQDADVQLLLCDYAMPGMNGVEVANLARTMKPSLRVVFMSGYADGNELADALGHGATILRKPFESDEVRRTIEAAVARSP